MTQRELAAKAGLSVATLRDFEQSRRHRPRANSLAALAGALGLSPDQSARLSRAATRPRPGQASMPAPRPAQKDSGSGRTAPSAGSDEGLWLAALGPLEAWAEGTPLPLGPPARRAVLGLLLMQPGALVRRDTIVDVLWGGSPPRTAVGLVQAHVSRIRKLLNSPGHFGAREGAIGSVTGAYRLTVSDQEVDLLVFRNRAELAAAARAEGDDDTAAEYYERAMGLWRGEPLADVELLRGHPGITALKQELIGELLGYAEVACALRQHHRVLPRLRALANAEPFNESAHAHLMIALAGSGQQAAALRVYQDVRSRLDRELGIYPGEEITEAYVRVLRQDIVAADRGRPHDHPAVLTSTVPEVPRQLPTGPRSFIGRADELTALSALVERDLRRASGVTIAALTGMAGIGKTALAVYWAHQVADRFPDGQLFVNLRGTPVVPTDAVRGFLTTLGVPLARMPPDTDGQAALYRSLLVGRRMLIVLDNAQNAEQVRPLLPGSPGCMVLVTSRNRLTGLAAAEGAHLMTLGVLSETESRDLLTSHLDAGRAMAEPATVSELVKLCGRLPLALCNIAACAVVRPSLPLAALSAEMRDSRRRLDALETGEPATSVRMVFSWSQASLDRLSLRTFRLLAVHPGPDITIPAAASLAGLPPEQAQLAVAKLCDEHLLTEYGPGRYACHDLLRSYATEEAGSSESEAGRQDAMHRMFDHYLHAATAASGFLCYPSQPEISWPLPEVGITPERIRGPRHAAEWFENEQHVLLGVIRQAAEGGYAPYAWQLPWTAGWYLRDEASWPRLAAAQESALVVAATLNDPAGMAMAHQHLGCLRFLLGDIVSAGHHLDKAIELSRRLGDSRLRAMAALSRASVLQAQDRMREAVVQTWQALWLYRAAEDAQGESHALYTIYTIGWNLVHSGDHRQAVQLAASRWRPTASLFVLTPRRGRSHYELRTGGGSAGMGSAGMNDVSERTEMLLPEPACALGALLGVPVPDLAGGEGLPPLWHWVYLLDRPAQADLGADGSPVRGTTAVSPGPGRRRMWAGGRVRISAPLRCGELATKRSRVLSVQEKRGRSGPLTFITVGHQILQHDRVVIDEQQDIVYRHAVVPAGPPPATHAEGPVVPAADGEWAIEVSPTLLFRFSALTYNAHRIHYDRDYATQREGYPGLVTHGPLQALAMTEAARAAGCGAGEHRCGAGEHRGGPHFEYRLTSPLFDHQGLVASVAWKQDVLMTAVRDRHGRQTAAGTIRYRE
jgi:hydroxyacyl-ACP dehydratase HTD2-like protein with hotdog domain/DNA-binding SARP family transcriptional activator/transcriptional regulator with XRE-family HTH domain/tetratricopeptide (TPR) repeat protein